MVSRFFTALAQGHIGFEQHEEDGLMIITDANDARIVDTHDKRLVVLSAEDARESLEQDSPVERALMLAQHSRPDEDFE